MNSGLVNVVAYVCTSEQVSGPCCAASVQRDLRRPRPAWPMARGFGPAKGAYRNV